MGFGRVAVSIAIEVNDIGEILHWENAFRVLGTKRCQASLLDAGVPAKMVSAPEGLMRAAHYFWQIRWQGITWQGIQVGQGYSDPEFPENYRLGILALLNNTFNLLVEDYGEGDANELYKWARHRDRLVVPGSAPPSTSFDDKSETLFTHYLDLWLLLLSPFRNSSTAFRLKRTRRPMRRGLSRRDRTSFHNVVREI